MDFISNIYAYVGIAIAVLTGVLYALKAIPGDQKEGVIQRILDFLKGIRR